MMTHRDCLTTTRVEGAITHDAMRQNMMIHDCLNTTRVRGGGGGGRGVGLKWIWLRAPWGRDEGLWFLSIMAN